MKKQNLILSAALVAVFSASMAFAEAEVTGKFVHESAKLVDGAKSAIKTESTVRIYIDGEAEGIAEGATYHVELQGHNDSTANYSSDAAYTQRDPLREAYVDMQQGDWSIRAGKQQVVWGTADGMKLLDMINPTDYAEMAQNQMEDSRIPVWMVNAEKDNLQVVISQAKENVFAGLNRGTDTSIRSNNPDGSDIVAAGNDSDSAFLMMGPETITGAKNGFLNIAPDLGSVAAGFGGSFTMLGSPATDLSGLGGANPSGNMSDLLAGFTVGAFTSGATLASLSTQFYNMQIGKYMMAGDSATVAASKSIGFVNLNFAAAVGGMACKDPLTGLSKAIHTYGAGTCADGLGNVYTGASAATDYNAVSGMFTGSDVLNGFGAISLADRLPDG